MASMNNIMQGVIGVVGGVIGLVIIQDVVDSESGSFSGLSETIVDYIVPLLALGLIAGAVTMWKFSNYVEV